MKNPLSAISRLGTLKQSSIFFVLIGLVALAACGDNTAIQATATQASLPGTTTTGSTTPQAVTTSTATIASISITPTSPTTVAVTTAPATTTIVTATDPEAAKVQNEVVRQWVQAVNTANQAAFEATFAPTASVTDSGRRFEGVAAIRGWSDRELLGVKGRIEIQCQEPSQNGVILNVKYSSGVYNGPGRYVFVVKNNLIQSIDMVAPLSSACQVMPSPQATTQIAAQAQPTVQSVATKGANNGIDTLDPAARCYVNAVNAKNLDALVNCFASDGTVVDVSRRIKGQDAIRTWARNEVIGGNLEVIENQVSPNRNRLLVHWAPAGSNGWRAWYTFEFANGKLTLADLQYA